jgi:hypothetical protein
MSRTVTLLGRGPGDSWSGDGRPIGQWIAVLAAALIVGLAVTAEARPATLNASPESPAGEGPEASLSLPRIGGWIMLADGVTLIVALPEKAQLAYIDTLEDRELKRVDLPFKPDQLAVQGKHLFASAYGGNAIHLLDLGSGVARKEVRLPDGPATGLVCHRERGPLFVSLPDPTMAGAVVTVDPNSGGIAYVGRMVPNRMDPAKVNGLSLAPDPANPEGFYSLVPWSAGRHTTPGLGLMRVGVKGTVPFRPYSGPPYKPPHHDPQAMPAGMVAVVGEFALLARVGKSGSSVHASGDGKRVGVIDYDGNGVTVLSAHNVNEKVGRMDCPYASDFAFHPVLDLAAVEGGTKGHERDRALSLFNCKSLAEMARFPLGRASTDAPDPQERLLTFGGRGTKLVYFDSSKHRLRFFPLSLTEKDKEALTKAVDAGHKR